MSTMPDGKLKDRKLGLRPRPICNCTDAHSGNRGFPEWAYDAAIDDAYTYWLFAYTLRV